MNDEMLFQHFEENTLPLEDMTHLLHIRIAWIYLKRMPLPEAMIGIRDGLRRFTIRASAPEKYHETITFSLLVLLAERMRRSPQLDWDGFVKANQDLLDNWKSGLEARYTAKVLYSEEARCGFLLPEARSA